MRLLLYLYIVVSVFLLSCKNINIGGGKSEGVIEYDIKYLQSEKENPLISLLPTTLVYKYKDDKIMQKIEGWMGVFHLAGIVRLKENYKAGYMKILGEKYVFETTVDGVSFGYDPYNKMVLKPVDSTKIIAGLKCKGVEVYLNDSTKPSFVVYYTDEIKIENPNCNNPFKEIKGVLMEYRMTFQKIPMKITARRVSNESVPEDEFVVPDGYQHVTLEKMQEVINNLM
ncbi:MAG: hypothetical protein N3A01_03290 [Bacteroidales bacterium]|nr:hypothetical protein [Bacteroidales bacterium]